MYSQEQYATRLDNHLEQILKDSESEMRERTRFILLEMQTQTEIAIKDVRQHINKIANG